MLLCNRMKYLSRLASASLVLFLSAVTLAHADASSTASAFNPQPLINIMQSILKFVDAVVVPFIFAIAFVVFLWGVFNYFILGGANEEKRSEGSKFVLWAVIGFVLMISVWGIVNLVKSSFSFGSDARPGLPTFGTASSTGGQQFGH